MISKSLEEYLKTMYILKKQKGNIRVTDIAEKMEFSKASVNKAIKNLKEYGLVNYETYGILELTDSGLDLAKKIIEAYDIFYLFFKDVLGIESDTAKVEAEKMKLIASDDTINKLAKYVYKTLNISELDCCYDINKEKCRSCSKKIPNKKKNIKMNMCNSSCTYVKK